MHHVVANGIHRPKSSFFNRVLSCSHIQTRTLSQVFAYPYIFDFFVWIGCTFPLEVDTIHNDMNMLMLLIVMTKGNKLIIVISHFLQVFAGKLSQHGVVNAWCIMWRKRKNEVSNRHLRSAAQPCMHHETIRNGLIVHQVNAITCCHQCSIFVWIIDIVAKTR